MVEYLTYLGGPPKPPPSFATASQCGNFHSRYFVPQAAGARALIGLLLSMLRRLARRASTRTLEKAVTLASTRLNQALRASSCRTTNEFAPMVGRITEKRFDQGANSVAELLLQLAEASSEC